MAKFLTKEALEKFKKELTYLENVKRKEIAERIRHAASFGDLKENAAYDEAKDAQGFLEGRILELKKIIANTRVVDKKANGKIQIGSTVSVESEGEKSEFQIVEPEEADACSGKISHQSPLGEALYGKRKGAKVKVETPGGKLEYRILEID